MDVRIVDREALRRRTPEQVLAYLAAHGWQQAGVVGGASYWHKGELEVVVPTRVEVDSYDSYVAQAVRTIARSEERTEIDILTAISQIEFDRQVLRSLVEDGTGTIAIADGVAEVDALHAWLAATASHLALRDKRTVLPVRKPVVAQRFLQSVRLGVPSEGSYMWSVLVPLTTDAADEPLYGIGLGDQDNLFPTPRQITRLLYRATDRALSAASQVIETDNYDVETFRGLLTDGVTSNLCQALADLGGESGIPYEIYFEWGAALPEPASPALRADRNQLKVMDAVASDLQVREPVSDVRVLGSVVRLHREGNTGSGEVSILGAMSDSEEGAGLARYWVELTEMDYDMATRAHIEGQAVGVTGTFEVQGQRRWLRAARGFTIVPLSEFGE